MPGYTPLLWNEFGTFLLGLQTYQGKDVQTEEMTGREWQSAIYVRDRWNVNPNFTISAGLRLEHYPLMSRDGRGIERLDLTTYEALIGGLGNTPDDVGINLKTWYFAPRLGAMYRFGEKAVARAGYGRTINPLPWSRPMRGSFPQDIFFNRTADQFAALGTLEAGHPAGADPGHQLGPGAAARAASSCGRRTRTTSIAASSSSGTWPTSTACRGTSRRRWPTSGRRTDGGYADLNLNYGVPGGGNAARQYFALAGTTAVMDWAARTKSRYHGLQLALNRPLRERPAAEGRLHLQPVEEHDAQRRGRLDRPHLEHPADVRPQLRAGRLRPPARVPDGRRLHAAVHEGPHGRRSGCCSRAGS